MRAHPRLCAAGRCVCTAVSLSPLLCLWVCVRCVCCVRCCEGSHAHRFDADGKGRGLAGRAEVVEFKGHTNTGPVEATVDHAKVKKPVVSSPLGAQKFGTQASKVAVVQLYRNGDKHHKGEELTLKGIKSMEQLLDRATSAVKLPTGAVRKLYKEGGKVTIKSLDELHDGAKYLCVGGEKIAEEDKLPAAWLTHAQ